MAKGAVLTNTILLLSLIFPSVSAQEATKRAAAVGRADSTSVDQLIDTAITQEFSHRPAAGKPTQLPKFDDADIPKFTEADATASDASTAVAQDRPGVATATSNSGQAATSTQQAVASISGTASHVQPTAFQDQQGLPQPQNIQSNALEMEAMETAEPENVYPAEGSGPVVLGEDGSSISGDFLGYWNNWCRAGFYGGAEGTFLAPLSEAHQSVVLTDLVNGTQYSGSTFSGFGSGVRSWLGLQSNGWGIRGRYWYFGVGAININPVVPINAQPTIEEAFLLRADVVDVELTQRFCLCGCIIDTSFGGRYAKLRRNSTILGYGTLGNGVTLTGLAVGANEISGSGFTTSIGGRKRLFCFCHDQCDVCCGDFDCYTDCHCGRWFGFWNFRGSLLWADSTVSALTQATAVVKTQTLSAAASSLDKASASKAHSENVGIVEFSAGIEYQRCLRCFPAIAFARVGLEYQHWETGNVFAQSDSFAFLQGAPPLFGGRVDASSVAHDGDLDLLGFTIGAGLTY